MRLTAEQRQTIKALTAEVFGPEASVKLFGSRLDDTLKGGDIDLLVSSSQPLDNWLLKAATLTAKLQMRLGDQPIDVLVVAPNTTQNPVHKHAQSTGQPL